MPIIRATPSVAPQPAPVAPPTGGQGLLNIAQGLQNLGAGLSNAMRIAGNIAINQSNAETAKRNAFASAKALSEVNQAELAYLREEQELRQRLTAEGREDMYTLEEERLFQFHRNNVIETTSRSLMGDATIAQSTFDDRFQSLRRQAVKTSFELTSEKARRTISERFDNLKLKIKSVADITVIDQELRTFFTDVDMLAMTGGINASDTLTIKESIIVEALKQRQQLWLDKAPDTAIPAMTTDTESLRDLLDGVNGLQLDAARQRSDTAFREETTRQLKTLIALHGISLEDALREAAKAGIDPAPIAAAYDSRVNREYATIDRRQAQDEKRAKQESDALAVEMMRTWLSKNFSAQQMQDSLDQNWISLLPDERGRMITFMQARTKDRANVVDDARTVRDLEFDVFENPTDPRTFDAIVAASDAGKLSESKMEELFNNLFANLTQIRNKAEETRYRQFQQFGRDLDSVLSTVGQLDQDPISQQVKDTARTRLNRAFWNQEQVKGDSLALQQNPNGFVEQLKREYRQQLDQALAESGFQLAIVHKYLLEPAETAKLIVLSDIRSRAITQLNAEKVLKFYELVEMGRFVWPSGAPQQLRKLSVRELQSNFVPPSQGPQALRGVVERGLTPQQQERR